MNGSTAGVSFAGSTITADYGADVRHPGAGRDRRAPVPGHSRAGLAIGTRVTNTGVVTWNNPTQTASASVSIDVGGMPGVGVLNGSGLARRRLRRRCRTPASARSTGWTVELYRDGQLAVLGADRRGRRVSHQRRAAERRRPARRYELRFRAPGAGANTAMLGRAASAFTNGLQRITDIVVHVRRQPAGPEPADRSERRRLQLDRRARRSPARR